MLLVGAAIKSEIEAAAAQKPLKGHSTPAPSVKAAA
jgi:hypothetical protein